MVESNSQDQPPERHATNAGLSRIPYRGHFILTNVLSKVWIISLAIGFYSTGVLYVKRNYDLDPGMPLEVILTFAVGIMLSIRVSKSYNRWWEARIQWGKLVNISRKLATKLRLYSSATPEECMKIHRLVQGFARSLKNHLRGGTSLQEVRGFNEAEEQPKHVPAYLSRKIYEMIEDWREAGRLSEMQTLLLDKEASELLEVSGACERINNTLMPPTFRAFVRFSIACLLLTLPWELADQIGWIVIPALVAAAFFAAATESLAHDMELPFGTELDNLDLEGYCNGIDQVTSELLDVQPFAD